MISPPLLENILSDYRFLLELFFIGGFISGILTTIFFFEIIIKKSDKTK